MQIAFSLLTCLLRQSLKNDDDGLHALCAPNVLCALFALYAHNLLRALCALCALNVPCAHNVLGTLGVSLVVQFSLQNAKCGAISDGEI